MSQYINTGKKVKKAVPQMLQYGQTFKRKNVDAEITSSKWKLLVRNSVGSAGPVVVRLMDSHQRPLMMTIVDAGAVVTCHFNNFHGISVQISPSYVENNTLTFSVSLAAAKESDAVQLSPVRQTKNRSNTNDNRIELYFKSPNAELVSFVPYPTNSQTINSWINNQNYDWHSAIVPIFSRKMMNYRYGYTAMNAYVHGRCTRQIKLGPIGRSNNGVEFILVDIQQAQIVSNIQTRETSYSQPREDFIKYIENGTNMDDEDYGDGEPIFDAGLYGDKIKVFIYLYDHDYTFPSSS